jgi:exopolyphosphatase/guanosine-5'-triphosphate,3'-diphosphate pyrophosphatase
MRLTVLLRLAVLLHRSRTDEPVQVQKVEAQRREIHVEFDPGWLAAHPLTAADLEHENTQLQTLGFSLKVS